MKKTLLICMLMNSVSLYGQDPTVSPSRVQIAVSTGTTTAAIRDGLISGQRYDGRLTPIEIEIIRPQRRFTFSYAGGTVRNYHIDAKVNDFSMWWEYRNNVKELMLFGKPSTLHLGASPGLWIYYRKQNVAEPFYFIYSFKTLLHMSFTGGLKGFITDHLSYDISTLTNVLTYGVSLEINEGSPETVSRFSTPFSDPSFQWSTRMHYALTDWLDAGLAYRFRYVGHDRLKLSSDSFLFRLQVNF